MAAYDSRDAGFSNGGRLSASTKYYYRINCGNAAGTTGDPPWYADAAAGGGTVPGGGAGASITATASRAHGNPTNVLGKAIYTRGIPIAAPATVYDCETWADPGNGGSPVTYTLDGLVPFRAYGVRSHHVETNFTAAGQRSFHVDFQGVRIITSLDIWSRVKANTPFIIERVVYADSAGIITLTYTDGSADHAEVAGIEIFDVPWRGWPKSRRQVRQDAVPVFFANAASASAASSAPTITVGATGASLAAGAAASAPAVTGGATGASLAAAAAASSPSVTGAATGGALFAGVGASSPAITGAATGAALAAAVGAASPSITGSASVSSLAQADASSAPSIAVAAASQGGSAADSAPTITATATGASLVAAAAASAPSIAGAATGAALGVGAAASSPTVTVGAVGASLAAAVASASPAVTADATVSTGAVASCSPTITVGAVGKSLAAAAASCSPVLIIVVTNIPAGDNEDEWHPDGNLGALVWRPDFYAEPPLS